MDEPLSRCHRVKLLESATSVDSSTSQSDTSSTSSEEEFIDTHTLWDWPLNENGLARAVESKDNFTVALEFSGLKNVRDIEVRKFENQNSIERCWSVGLCTASDDESKKDRRSFWRMEIQVLQHMNLITVEINREVARNDRRCRSMKKYRKIYKLPESFDINTLQTRVNPAGSVVLQALRKKPDRKIFVMS